MKLEDIKDPIRREAMRAELARRKASLIGWLDAPEAEVAPVEEVTFDDLRIALVDCFGRTKNAEGIKTVLRDIAGTTVAEDVRPEKRAVIIEALKSVAVTLEQETQCERIARLARPAPVVVDDPPKQTAPVEEAAPSSPWSRADGTTLKRPGIDGVPPPEPKTAKEMAEAIAHLEHVENSLQKSPYVTARGQTVTISHLSNSRKPKTRRKRLGN